MNIVRYREDEIPPITPEREAKLRALAEMPDSEIDLSDMPEWTKEDFQRARPLQGVIALSNSERSGLFHKMLAEEESGRAAEKIEMKTEHVPAEA